MEQEENKGIYINGKQQIIDMLRFMNGNERDSLLKNISKRNSVAARELAEKSYSFKDLVKVSNESLRKIFSQCSPAIVGLSLYTAPSELQRKVLSSMDRTNAEEAYRIMAQNLNSKKLECQRAQEKVIQVLIQLSRRQQIDL